MLPYFPDCLLRGQVEKVEFDVFLPSLQVGIEYDGKAWHEKRRLADIYKNNKAEELGIKLIRLRQDLDKISDADIQCGKEITKITMNALVEKLLEYTVKGSMPELIDYINQPNFMNGTIYRKVVSELPAPEYKNSFEARFPSKAKCWDYKKNHPILPRMVTYGSTQKFWWICKSKGHSFDMQPCMFSRDKTNCPVCSGHRIVFENSLTGKYPQLAAEWDVDKNDPVSPDEIAPNSIKRYWWRCPEGHSYPAQPNHRVSMNSGCSVCAGRLPDEGKSFEDVYPELTKKLKLDPRNKINWHRTPLGSHTFLKYKCTSCSKTIKREVRRWIQAFQSLGDKSFTCQKCLNLVEYEGTLVSLEDLEKTFGLPRKLLQGRIGHGKSATAALQAGLGLIKPKIVFNGSTYSLPNFCENFGISANDIMGQIGKKPIDDII